MLTVMDGGSVRKQILVNAEELTTIYNHLLVIVSDLEEYVVPNVEKLKNLNYYTAGEALDAVEASKRGNERIYDLLDHYNRLASLIIEALQSMMERDEAVAQHIIAALEF